MLASGCLDCPTWPTPLHVTISEIYRNLKMIMGGMFSLPSGT